MMSRIWKSNYFYTLPLKSVDASNRAATKIAEKKVSYSLYKYNF